MADIATDVDSWSSNEASNSPSGATTIGTGLDDNLRAIQAAVKAWKDEIDPYSHKNAVINGDFRISQRGATFTSATTPANSDDTYLLDRWNLLSDGNDIVDVSQEATTVPSGGLNAIALDVETANKKFGIIQFIEQKNSKGFIGNTCTLSFKARKGGSNATVGTMRAVILSWDGTADTVTSDVVSAWNVSGTNPTYVANWTAENTAADLTLTTSYQTFSVSAAIDTASTKNIAVFLYYNNADGTVADFIYITDVQLEVGSNASVFEYRPIQIEKALCQRYWHQSYADGTAAGTSTATNAMSLYSHGDSGSATQWMRVSYCVPMRVAPTVTLYSSTGASAKIRDATDGADVDATTSGSGTMGFTAQTNGAGLTSNQNGLFHYTANAEL